jgi:2-oxoglutarate dehydrogenase complex dehydrogenase (E1) component-like enzyme
VKPFGIPIVRVNTSDVDSVARVSKFLVRYWQKYGKDILVDMIGYRKYGHNEVDEPAFTQPAMYEKIRALRSVGLQYAEQLISQGIIKESLVEKTIS